MKWKLQVLENQEKKTKTYLKVLELIEKGLSVPKISNETGIKRTTIHGLISKWKLKSLAVVRSENENQDILKELVSVRKRMNAKLNDILRKRELIKNLIIEIKEK
jgi:predicted DNA-binding protein YlxM (UPF0122 family)